MNYSAKIQSIRISKNLSIRKFAKLVGCSHTYIPQLECGISSSNKPLSPTIEILKQICDRTDYDFAIFLAETGYIDKKRVCLDDDEIVSLQAIRASKNMEIAVESDKNIQKNVEIKN